MPIARVQMPDGRIARIEVPEGTTPEQATAMAQGVVPGAAKAQSPWWGDAKPKPPSAGRAMADSAAAVGGGLFRGAASFPDMLADAGDAVTRGFTSLASGGLRAVGADDAARFVERGSPGNKQQFRMGQIPDRLGTPRLVAPGAELGSNLLGAAVIPMGPPATRAAPRIPPPRPVAASSPARDVLEAGSREGVRVMRTDIKPPRTAMGRAARWLGEKIPFAGTGGMREGQQAQRIEAIKNVLTDFGGNAERTMLDDTAAATNAVASNLATTRGNALGRLSAQKQAVITSLSRNNDIVPVDRTISAIDDQIAALTRRGTPAAQEAAKTLQGYRAALPGKTLDQLEAIRADELSNAFKGGNTLADVKVVGEKALRSIYDPLRAEMGTFIRQRGGEKALNQWAKANENLSSMAGELKSARFKNVLRNEELTPEAVKNLLFSQNRSDVARLMGNLDKRGQAKAREAILQRAYDGSIGTDGLSAERFISNVNRLGPSITEAFKGPDLQRVQGLTRLLDATRRASEAGRMPATGAQNTPLLVAAGMLQMLGQAGTAIVGGGYGLLARAYESVPVRRELMRLAKVKAGTRSETEIVNRAAVALSLALREQMTKAANSNVPMRASAGETPEDQQRQQRGF